MLKFTTTILIIVFVNLSFAQEIPVFVKKVFDDIYSTMDNGQVIKPNIIISNNIAEVASFTPTSNEIRIGTEFIKLARSFGKDSSVVIAHVLGHELAHVLLQQNDFVKKIGSGYASIDYNKSLRKLHKTLKDSVFERQADEFSALYAYMSGYKTLNIAPTILDSIYQHFQLKDELLTKYPTLAERKLIAKTTSERMQVLASVFDYANIAMIAGKYDIAISMFNTIVKEKFPSREIYNNIGVLNLLKAIELLDKKEYPYVFPCEIDLNTRLKENNVRGLTNETEDFLIEAIRNFDLALKNKSYYASWLNKAIAELLLERFDDFQISMLMAKRSDMKDIQQKIKLLMIINEHINGDNKKAELELKDLAKNDPLAELNFKYILESSTSGVHQTDSLKSESYNWIIKLKENEKSLPQFDFYSKEARSNDLLKNTAKYERNLSMCLLGNDSFDCYRFYYRIGDVKPSVKIYEMKKAPHEFDFNLHDVIQLADAYYTLNNLSFLKFGSTLITIQNNKLVNCYFIN